MAKRTSILFWILFLIFVFGFGGYSLSKIRNTKNPIRVSNEKVFIKPEEPKKEEKLAPSSFLIPKSDRTVKNFKIPILMYHQIRDYNNPKDNINTNLSVSPLNFKKQLDFLKASGYETIGFEELLKIYSGEADFAKKPVILTFDDGYRNFYTDAFPLLKERQMKGVVFIPSNFVGALAYLTGEQIKFLSDWGIIIGDHSVSHIDLAKGSISLQTEELKSSKIALEKIIGKPVLDLAYPLGKYNNQTIEIAKSLGFRTAVTTNYGLISPSSNLMQLQRIRVTNNTNLAGFLP